MAFKEGIDYTLITESEYNLLDQGRSTEKIAKILVFNDEERKNIYAALYLKLYKTTSKQEAKILLKELRDFHYPTANYFEEEVINLN